jgi:hypothetical protein
VVSTIGGKQGAAFGQDGPGPDSRLSKPRGITIASNGDLIIADTGNHSIRRAVPTNAIAPVVFVQPMNQLVSIGDPATISVAPGGTPPFAYQWQKNGLNIADATNAFLRIGALTADDLVSYRVIVANAVGSITSSVAQLSGVALNLFPVLTIYDSPGKNYRIEATPDLSTTNVWNVITNMTLPSNPYHFIDPQSPQAIRRFYRAVPLP